MKIHFRRRTKIVSGIVAVLVLAVLVVGFVTGLPGSGRKLLGSAYIDPEYSYVLVLESGWIGASIGRLVVTNTRQHPIKLHGYHRHYGFGGYMRQWGYFYFHMGEALVQPGGHVEVFDYKGLAMIELYEQGIPYSGLQLSWSEVKWTDNPIGGTGIWGPRNLHWGQ